MNVIYEPKGRAREYAELALNLFTGCSFGCKYCYCPLVLHRDRETFHANAYPRHHIIEQLVLDARKFKDKGETRPILLSFVGDVYQPLKTDEVVTRRAMEILHKNGLHFSVLTKAGKIVQLDFDLYETSDRFGQTLTFIDPRDSRKWEPFAALPDARLDNLSVAHSQGIHTWASLEPVIDPKQTLELIEESAEYVDEFKIGKWNYDSRAEAIDWQKFTNDAVKLLETLGKKYLIKKDLRPFLNGESAMSGCI